MILITVMPMLYVLTLMGALLVHVSLVMLRMERLVMVKLVIST